MDFTTRNSCRLCLKLTSEENLTPLFESYGKVQDAALEWRRIFSFIYNIQGLPDKICNNCKAQTEWILNFHNECYENDVILRLNQIKKSQIEFSERQDTITSISYEENNLSSDQIHEAKQEYDTITNDFAQYGDEQMVVEEGIFVVEENDLNFMEQEYIIVEPSKIIQSDDESKEKSYEIDHSKNMDIIPIETSDTCIAGKSSLTKAKARYNCPICKKSFTKSSNKYRHQKKHENPKPFECIIAGCNKKFSNKKSKDDHIKTIHEGCTYKCPVCSHIEKYRVNVANHIRNFHSGSHGLPIEYPKCG